MDFLNWGVIISIAVVVINLLSGYLINKWVPRGQKLVVATALIGLQVFFLRLWVISSTIYPLPSDPSNSLKNEIIEILKINPEINSEEFDKIWFSMNTIQGWQALPDAVIHTLQTFSMDEDYTLFQVLGRFLLYNHGLEGMIGVYEGYSAILNVLAPVFGGALIISILTTVWPRIRFFASSYKPMFIFSELNAQSINLAEDLNKQSTENLYQFLSCPLPKYLPKNLIKPLLIFTDVYPDEKSEKMSELVMRARDIRAFCFPTDASRLNVRYSHSVLYFLMDEDFEHSMETFAQLASQEKKVPPFWRRWGEKLNIRVWPEPKKNGAIRTKIYLFITKSESLKQVRSIQKKYELNGYMSVFTVRTFQNMSYHLAKDIPFFLPLLLRKSSKKKLTVTVVGDGTHALELVKTVFWAGQIPNYELQIILVSPDPLQYYGRIKRQCPELLQTSTIHFKNEEILPNAELLKIYPKKDDPQQAPAYADIVFYSQNDFIDTKDNGKISKEILQETDYFLIAVGSDKDALELTMSLDLAISRANMELSEEEVSKIIVPVIYDQIMAQSIERKETKPFENYILPIGTFDSQATARAIFFDDLMPFAQKQQKNYAQVSEEIHAINSPKEEYDFWSNIARNIHAPYKLFGLGNFLSTKKFVEQIIRERQMEDKYRGLRKSDINDPKFKNTIAWSEKRRWNAYTRSIGFRYPTPAQIENMKKINESLNSPATKNFEYNLHRCLVEVQFETPVHTEESLKDEVNLDALDLLSLELTDFSLKLFPDQNRLQVFMKKDYKQYDQFSAGDNEDVVLKILYQIDE